MIDDTIANPRKRAFLHAYSIIGRVSFAAHEAGIRRELHYDWLKTDPQYVEAFKLAERMAGDALKDEAMRRAHKGVKEPVLYQGEQVKVERVNRETGEVTLEPLYRVKYSDTLLMFLLEGLVPETFHERKEIAHKTPEPIAMTVEHTHALDLSKLTEEELTTLERLAAKLTPPDDRGGSR